MCLLLARHSTRSCVNIITFQIFIKIPESGFNYRHYETNNAVPERLSNLPTVIRSSSVEQRFKPGVSS